MEEEVKSPLQSVGELLCEVRLIDSIAALDHAKETWIQFIDRPTVFAGIFTDPRLLDQHVCFDNGEILALYEVKKSDRLVAIVPLIVRNAQIPLRFGLVTLARVGARLARIADFEFPAEAGN